MPRCEVSTGCPFDLSAAKNPRKAFESQLFTLEVNQTAKIDGTLSIGDASQTVEVQDQLQPILDTENATISSIFTANTIQNFPLNGRNFSSITMFIPGAVATEPTGMTGPNAIERSTNQAGQVSINGNRNQTNNYCSTVSRLTRRSTRDRLQPEPGCHRQPHCHHLERRRRVRQRKRWRRDRRPQERHQPAPRLGLRLPGELQPRRRHLAIKFAGNSCQPFTQTIFGGPIKRDKLFFFFVDYEGTRYHKGGTQTASVIPAAFCTGNFSPLPTQLTHYVSGVGQVAYANNQVPITNPVVQYLFAHPELYPLPNKPGTDSLGIQNNYIGTYLNNTVRNDQGDVKIDYSLSKHDTIMARYSQGEASDATPKTPIVITFPGTNSYPFKGIALNWVHTFSPTIEARGWSRIRWVQSIPQDTTGIFGTNGNSVVGINGPNPYPCFALRDFANGQGRFNTTYLADIGTRRGCRTLRLLVPTALWPVQARRNRANGVTKLHRAARTFTQLPRRSAKQIP